MAGRIITSNVFPPIPDRRFDWMAYHEGDEESQARHGWGATETDAIADLKRIDEEFLEAEAAEAEATGWADIFPGRCA